MIELFRKLQAGETIPENAMVTMGKEMVTTVESGKTQLEDSVVRFIPIPITGDLKAAAKAVYDVVWNRFTTRTIDDARAIVLAAAPHLFAHLSAENERLTNECSNWEETAREFAASTDFYRDLLRRTGELFGIEAKTSDDGSVQEDVLALKVPELVERLQLSASHLSQENERLTKEIGSKDKTLTELVQVAESFGWNGVENSKILVMFFASKLRQLIKAEARVKELESLSQALVDCGDPKPWLRERWATLKAKALGLPTPTASEIFQPASEPSVPSPSTVSNQTACAQLVDPANSIAESVSATPPEASKVPDSEFILLRDNRNPLQEFNDELRKQLATVTKERDELLIFKQAAYEVRDSYKRLTDGQED